MKKKSIAFFLACLFSVFILSSLSYAGEQGHYSPAPLVIRDYVMPPQGSYFVMYNTYYYSDDFMDSNRDKFDSMTASGSATILDSGDSGDRGFGGHNT